MIRIALISDIHFGKDSRTSEYALPNQKINGDMKNAQPLTDSAVQIMKEHNVDYLFIAGDLTSVGDPVEFYYCEKKIKEIIELTGLSEEHVILCSGNHDNDWTVTSIGDSYKTEDEEVLSLAREKYGVLASSMADNCLSFNSNLQKGVLPSSGIYEDESMVVFVLNSSSQCIRKENVEHGSLTPEQLSWVEEKFKNYEEDPRWKIVMVHHHPFNYKFPYPSLDLSQIEEGSELCELVGKYGVDLVIHGHRHHPRCKTVLEGDWKKPVSFVCGGSFAVNDRCRNLGEIPNTFHILELSDEVGKLKLYTFEYSTCKGWIPVNSNRDELPLDRVMYLGDVFEEKDSIEAFSNIVEGTDKIKIINWEDLDDSLKYKSTRTLISLAERVKQLYSCEIKILPLDSIVVSVKENA